MVVLEAVMVSKESILAHLILLRPPQVADRFGRRRCLAAEISKLWQDMISD